MMMNGQPRHIAQGTVVSRKMPILVLCLSAVPLIGSFRPAAAGTSGVPGAPAATLQVTAIRAGKFIDVEAGRVLANQVIVIRGSKIEAVGANVAVPPGAKLVDLSKMTVLPGLIDCHTHLADLAD